MKKMIVLLGLAMLFPLFPLFLGGCMLYTKNTERVSWSDGGSLEPIEVGSIDYMNQNMKVLAIKQVQAQNAYFAQTDDGFMHELTPTDVARVKHYAEMKVLETAAEQTGSMTEIGLIDYAGQDAKVWLTKEETSQVFYFAQGGNGFLHQLAPAAVGAIGFYAGMEALRPDQNSIDNSNTNEGSSATSDVGDVTSNSNPEIDVDSRNTNYNLNRNETDVDVSVRQGNIRPSPHLREAEPQPVIDTEPRPKVRKVRRIKKGGS